MDHFITRPRHTDAPPPQRARLMSVTLATQILNLNLNQGLSGPIPENFGRLTKMKMLVRARIIINF